MPRWWRGRSKQPDPGPATSAPSTLSTEIWSLLARIEDDLNRRETGKASTSCGRHLVTAEVPTSEHAEPRRAKMRTAGTECPVLRAQQTTVGGVRLTPERRLFVAAVKWLS